MRNSVARVGVDAVHVFCRDLKQLHRRIGEPPFGVLEKLADELRATGHIARSLPRSTINDTVLGKRLRTPEWEWVRDYVRVCRVYAERNSASIVDQLASEEYWQNRWYKTKQAEKDTARWPVAVETSDRDEEPEDRALRPSSRGAEMAPEFAESWNARRYHTFFGAHGVALLKAAERRHSLAANERRDGQEACCRLGILLVCVGFAQEGEVWLSFAARDAEDPIAEALLHTPRNNRGLGPDRLQFAAECLYDMAVSEEYQQRKRTGDARPAPWIDLYLSIAARYGSHKDAAYHLAIRSRARGHDDNAAYWFAFADKLGHRAAPDRFEAIYQEIRTETLADDEWILEIKIVETEILEEEQ